MWMVFTMTWGHRFTSQYGIEDDGTWYRALRGFDPEAITRAYETAVNMGREWPPTLPEFKRMVREAGESIAMYRDYKRLPTPVADPAIAHAHMDRARRILRGEDVTDEPAE